MQGILMKPQYNQSLTNMHFGTDVILRAQCVYICLHIFPEVCCFKVALYIKTYTF